jgi:hypothetical protein
VHVPDSARRKATGLIVASTGCEGLAVGVGYLRSSCAPNKILFGDSIWLPTLLLPLGSSRRAPHSEELSELYLGANAPDNLKAGIVALAESINPDIAVYEMFYNGNGNLLSRFFH